jgi:uncharacterized protein (DUF1697 family)
MALVVFLRGVNVGGHRTFRPSALAKELNDFGAVNIGAAGTFIIRRAVAQARLRAEILRKLPFVAEIMICDGRDLIRIAATDPFGDLPSGPRFVRFVSILAKSTRMRPAFPVHFPPSGDWVLKVITLQDRFLFGMYRREMKAIGYLGQLDQLCGVPVTTRNWNTIQSIARALRWSATV